MLTMTRAANTASNQGRVDSLLAGKPRHALRSMRSLCTTKTLGVAASVLLY